MQLRPNLRSKTLQWLFIILLSSLIIYLNDWYGSDNRSFKIGEKNKALYKFFEGIYISFRNFFRNFLKLASKLSVDGINDGGEVSREERLKMVMEKSLVMEEKLREKMERRGR